MADFGTVSLMRETPEMIGRFVDYYRRAGASEILIYHDGKAPELALERPAVLVECDEAFWAARGGRPDALEDRQSAVFLAGHERAATSWLLVVDADEFVFGNRPIADFLDRIPDEVDAVRVPTAEAVWGPSDPFGVPFAQTHFRTAWPTGKASRLMRRLTFGKLSAQMRRGVTGHARGKEFVRTGRGIEEIGNHTAWRGGREVTVGAKAIDRGLDGMYLGHFDGVGLSHWERKWRMRAEKETHATKMSRSRTTQMATIMRGMRQGEDAMRALFARYYGLTRPQYFALSTLGFAFRREIFPPEGEPADPAAGQAGRLRTSPTMS